MTTREFTNGDLLDLIRWKRGMQLCAIDLTGEMKISSDHGYDEWLAGPFAIQGNDEDLIFITYTETDSIYVQFLIRDREGNFVDGEIKPISLGHDTLASMGYGMLLK